MAQLAGAEQPQSAGTRLSGAQFRVILWLRWRLLVNSLGLRGGKAELAGRTLLVPIIAGLVLLPALFAGFGAWYMASQGLWRQLSWLFWAAFLLAQLLSLNLGQPGTSFDPAEFIRFPVTLRNFVLIRLCFGLLSPSNIVVTLMSVAIFVGITVQRPTLWPWVLLATAAFALANVLFTRMVFAWVDRWLSTRRAREVLTGFIFVLTLGIQYLNFSYNPGFQTHSRHTVNRQKLQKAEQIFRRAQPWLSALPPELAGNAIEAANAHDNSESAAKSGLILGYAALFLGVYTVRMRTEYRGENLSDSAAVVSSSASLKAAFPPPSSVSSGSPAASRAPAFASGLTPPVLGPMIAHEILLIRRNMGLLYGIVAPTAMIFLFAGRLSVRGTSPWVLLAAVGYALLGLAPMSYNSFGLEGTGAQLYFYAPLRLRVLFLAKNLVQLLLALIEVVIVIAIVSYYAGRPSWPQILFVGLWALASLLVNTTVGNLRSLAAPKKVNPGRSWNRSQSQLSVWMSIAILAGCAGLGLAAQYAGTALHSPWVSVGLIALLTVAACFGYERGLHDIERFALDHRESLFKELGKKT